MTAYYNEIEPFAAQWLRNLIDAGHIAPGEVDTRDIRDVTPNDLRGFTQCHFFAGIGVWSHALRRAGWPDDRPVWTGSCPCQPFSATGRKQGFTDERHLWPAWFHLIEIERPVAVFGEQVSSKDGLSWLDLVWTDMEAAGYTFAPLDLCAAGFGAPHIRQRQYFVGLADSDSTRLEGWFGVPECPGELLTRSHGLVGGLADSASGGSRTGLCNSESPAKRRAIVADDGGSRRLDDTDSRSVSITKRQAQERDGQRSDCSYDPAAAMPTNGFWRDADWLYCRDNKWRPVKSGTFPLVDGLAARMEQLRAYGNAIVAPQAEEFIRAATSYIELRASGL